MFGYSQSPGVGPNDNFMPINLFFRLLRIAFGLSESFPEGVSEHNWQMIYEMAEEQSLLGVLFREVEKLPAEKRPGVDLLLSWAWYAMQIEKENCLMNRECARLTLLFAKEHRRSAILKGQANARLYPNPLSRQVGDIDIWVEGGRDKVIELLRKLEMMDEIGDLPVEGKATLTKHHVHLPAKEQGIVVEVHFLPSSGNCNPCTNRRMMKWLEKEIIQTQIWVTGDGDYKSTHHESRATNSLQQFCVPSVKFALVMQLSHIQRHFLEKGIGLRQVCDYYLLLQHSTSDDRKEVAELLQRFGLSHIAGALMWILQDVFHLDEGLMLCKADRNRGEWMLRDIMEIGRLERHTMMTKKAQLRRFMALRWRSIKLLRFAFGEKVWAEWDFGIQFFKLIPLRIKYRTFSLADV
jgi:hypothetical protein